MPKWEYEERQARLRFPLLVSPILNFLHSHDDCSSIANCCRRISPRLIVLTVYGLVPFISVSRFEIVTLRFPVRGSSGRIELDPSCRTDHSTI